MSTWTCEQKVCATCRFWQGKRDVDFMACFFEAFEKKALCAVSRGRYKGVRTEQSSTCEQWQFFREDR